MYKHINCLILTGGKNSRMGSDKALIQVNGESLINRTFDIARSLFPKVYICGNGADKYNLDAAEPCEDIYPGGGPLSGIHSGLKRSDKEINFVLSCDMPSVKINAIEEIIKRYKDESVFVPESGGKIHFLFGIYRRSILPVAEQLFTGYKETPAKNKSLSLYSLFRNLDFRTINFDDEEFAGLRTSLLNLNTPEDLADYTALK